jgi:hypothetical protein
MAAITATISSVVLGETADGVKVVQSFVLTDNGTAGTIPVQVNKLQTFKDWTASSTSFFVSCISSVVTSGTGLAFAMNSTSGYVHNLIDVTAGAQAGAAGSVQILSFGA